MLEETIIYWSIFKGKGHWVICDAGGPFAAYHTYREAAMNFPHAALAPDIH